MRFDEFDQYSENLLLAQYDVSEIISHELMKGEVREDFIIDVLKSCSDPAPNLVKGTVSDGTNDAGQLDIILLKPYAHPRRVGTQYFVAKEDALCILEVKGNCRGKDLKKANLTAEKIRNLQGDVNPLYGVICYKVELQEKTILKRFGFSFDSSTQTYFDRANVPNEDEDSWQKLEYPNLDFFISIGESDKMFLRKYEPITGKSRFYRNLNIPLIQEVFSLIRGLWIESNRQNTNPIGATAPSS